MQWGPNGLIINPADGSAAGFGKPPPAPQPTWGPMGINIPSARSARPPAGAPTPRSAGLGGSYPGGHSSPSSPGRWATRTMSAGQPPVRPWEQGLRSPHNSPYMAQPAALSRSPGGVRPGNNMMGGPSVSSPGQPSLQQIQAEMARRQVGAQLGPRNAALSGYMMGK